MSPQFATFVIAMLALNLSVLLLLARILSGTDINRALKEKDPAVVEETARALTAAHFAAAESLAPAAVAAATSGEVAPVVPAAPTPQEINDALPASYSRIAGAFGAIVLAGALYAVANYITWAAFFEPDKISPVLDKMGSFFLAGSALFAPYAFNQLTSIFPRPPATR